MTTETKATQLQTAMIKKIVSDETHDMVPECAAETITWASNIIETAEDKGVFTSLLNAELVIHVEAGAESMVQLTEKAWELQHSL